MGLWDSIKSAALKAKCTVGIHGGNFRPIEGETCKYSKICPDCHETIKTERHQLGRAEYKLEYKCVTVKNVLNAVLKKKVKNTKGTKM